MGKWLRRKVLLRRILCFEIVIIALEFQRTIVGTLVRGYPSIGGEVFLPLIVVIPWGIWVTNKRDEVINRRELRKARNEQEQS